MRSTNPAKPWQVALHRTFRILIATYLFTPADFSPHHAASVVR
jgi:hypothetical protein